MVVETTQDARTDVTVMAHVVYLGLVSAFVIGVHRLFSKVVPFGFAIINSGGRDINVDGDTEDATNIGINSGSKSTVPGTMVCKERFYCIR